MLRTPDLKATKTRLAVVYLCFVAFALVVGFRLVQLQVITKPELDSLAQRQFQSIDTRAPYRAPIYDRNGEELAVSISSSSVFARPKLIRARLGTARALAAILGGPAERWLAKLDKTKSFVWLQRQVSPDVARKLSKKNLAGIFIEPENKRVYPNGPLAAHLLGFTDIDGGGLAGLELLLNKDLLQQESRIAVLRDGRGTPSYLDKRRTSVGGGAKGAFITIDRRLQHAVEEELDRALAESGARAAIAVVMDPHNGEIFALGQRPAFDPNRANQFPQSWLANRAVSHLYEPGSTLKVLFAAEALQQGIFHRNSLIDCGNGQITVGDRTIREADAHHKFGQISVEKVLRYSSNVGAVKIVQALGPDRARSVLDKFGLTSRTGVRLPGEAFSAPRGDDFWTPVHLATVGFGQGISANPLQVIASFAPFANGGYLVRPRILKDEGKRPDDERLDLKRVIGPAVAKAIRESLISVTEEKGGTGKLAAVPGVRVAGKTGTAQKYQAGVGYSGGKYFSSFIGFLPADRPELLIGVMVDEPEKEFYASQIAAPVFSRIAERSLQILNRLPRQTVARAPLMPTPSHEKTEIEFVETENGRWVMPDLKGVGMRQALRAVGSRLENVKVSGAGYVKQQFPPPGSVVTAKTRVTLDFSPST